MFTIDQIKSAHSKVKSGADFPAYVQEIKTMGVAAYETYVADGHTDYYGIAGYKISAPAKHHTQTISDIVDKNKFISGLKAHQQGNTAFPTFITMCAATGIEKWYVSTDEMTCMYYDKTGAAILVEKIPGSEL